MRILVVDDSKAMRGIIKRTLSQAGFADAAFLEAGSGTEALEVVGRERPELIVADLNMPQMDGLELLQALRTQGLDTAFGLVTSEPGKARSQALAAGALFVIGKPVTVDSLKEALSQLRTAAPAAIPTGAAVAELLAGLLGRAVSQRPASRGVLATSGPVLVGTFGDEAGGTVGLLACDLELSVRLGLAMLAEPATRAEPLLRAGELPEGLLEGLREFLSVGSTLFNGAGRPAVSLRSTHTLLRTLPPRVVAMCISPSARLELELDVSGYGKGHLHLCLA